MALFVGVATDGGFPTGASTGCAVDCSPTAGEASSLDVRKAIAQLPSALRITAAMFGCVAIDEVVRTRLMPRS
jgi:hypothetical protein